MNQVKPIPPNSSVVIPMLVCRNVVNEIDFCKISFGADELGQRPGPDGAISHALLSIKGQMLIIEAEWPTIASRPPELDGSSPIVIFIYVEDVDKTIEQAVAAGARILIPVKNQFWGDRSCRIMDPAGHVWTVATRIEETTTMERDKRWSEIVKELK